ncbi:MAG: nucleotidyltransferase domain-containing protein [Planctomycetota bacterium]|nr:nucleotidyltransferase domain-containing protein [Planctomycetota bacterium]
MVQPSAILDALFPRTRQEVLAATFLQQERWWYLRDLARHLSLTPSSLQRELAQLISVGLLSARKDGNRHYFRANSEHPIHAELRAIFNKTQGIDHTIRELVFTPAVRGVEVALVFGSVARGEEDASSDIDLLVIGSARTSALNARIRKAELQLGRPINLVVFPRDEFAAKVRVGHHFVTQVMQQPKLYLVGTEDDLAKAAQGRKRSVAHRDAARD